MTTLSIILCTFKHATIVIILSSGWIRRFKFAQRQQQYNSIAAASIMYIQTINTNPLSFGVTRPFDIRLVSAYLKHIK